MTTVQTSTSLGVYRTYNQTYRYPLFHSWTMHGFYTSGVETNFDLVFSNDFAQNDWKFFPTQMEVDIPFGKRYLSDNLFAGSEKRSRIQLGRQLLTEGFDLEILDGVRIPYYLTSHTGIAPFGGVIRSPDQQEEAGVYVPAVGGVVWTEIWGTQLRGGYIARDTDFTVAYAHGSLLKQFEGLWFQPQIFVKDEWNANTGAFNQSNSELTLNITDEFFVRGGHSYLQPRPTQKKDATSFLYRVFSVTPTEVYSGDLSWQLTEDVKFDLGGQQFTFNSGNINEIGQRADVSLDTQIFEGHWLTTSFTRLNTWGGQLYDTGIRLVSTLGDTSRLNLEYDVAYVDKINQIHGWLHHVRTGLERMMWDRAKAIFYVEAERNQYYQFDVRTMVYVTNYL